MFTLGARALHHVALLFLLGFAEVFLLLLGFVIGAHVNAPFLYVLALFHFAGPERLNVLFFVIEGLAHVAVHFEEVKSPQVLVTVGHELSAPFSDGRVRWWLLELEVGRWRGEVELGAGPVALIGEVPDVDAAGLGDEDDAGPGG